jgi:hypothetical protein
MKDDPRFTLLVSVVSLILAIIALFLSYQANQIAKAGNQIEITNASPNINVSTKNGFNPELFYISPCKKGGYGAKVVTFDYLSISNRGGRSATLMEAELITGPGYVMHYSGAGPMRR